METGQGSSEQNAIPGLEKHGANNGVFKQYLSESGTEFPGKASGTPLQTGTGPSSAPFGGIQEL